jgi:outer membrane protein OmpA-like peptidoglycan-associated protein
VEETVTEEPAEEPAVEEAVTEEPVEEPAVDEAVTEQPTEEPAADEAVTEEPAEEPAVDEVVTEQPAEEPAVEETVTEEPATTPRKKRDRKPVVVEVLTEEPTEVPVVEEEAVQALGELLGTTAEPEDITADRPAPAAEAALIPLTLDADDSEGPAPEGIVEQLITEENSRSSDEEFRGAPEEVATEGGRDRGLSDLEKVGLIALGALVVGAILNNGDEVVENTGDRVIVRNSDGGYYVYKDDDTLLRRPGSTVRTETYADGSTRTLVLREDGSQIVTIRDASGRVLRRATYDAQGREIVLIDDMVTETYVDVTTLPTPRRERVTISTSGDDAALKAAMAAAEAKRLGRAFSLRQIREITEVRALAATVDVTAITFDSGSAAIKPTEAEKLADLGSLLTDLITANPAEVFLIEGHTDAVGGAASNLALSDRRAESVALALTEYFGVPPENLVVQGYGEGELLVETQADERANRRAVVRVITPLMQTASR